MPTQIKVTGGSLFIYSPGNSDFTLRTSAFSAKISLSDIGSFAMPNFLAPGSTYAPHGTLAGDQTLHNGCVDYGGQMYPTLWFTGLLGFSAAPFTVPTSSPSRPSAKTTAFTFDGTLNAYLTNPFIDVSPAVFEFQLLGKGKVTTRMTPIIAGASRDVTSYFYSFT